MTRRIIDISVPLMAGIASDPPGYEPKITYLDHATTGPAVAGMFPPMTVDQLPGGAGWAIEQLQISTHTGTHLDAPYHHHPTMSKGQRAITIDEVPLDWCLQPGVKLDFRHLPDGYVATPGDVEAELKRIGHQLQPLEIVVVNTAAGGRYGEDDYIHRGCGMGRAATNWLTERGVRITGTDGWSWDAPFSHTLKSWAETGDPGLIWEGHRASMDTGYCHIEKLANLDQLPDNGFVVSCFPFNIKGASAGFCRAVAILND